MNRAWARLETKAIRETVDAYVITGIATTPRTDRMQDIVEPMGARYGALPKLFMHHDAKKPIGGVSYLKPTKTGIPFEARIPKVTEPGIVRDRIDEAVHSVKYDLLSYVSIGFSPKEYGPIDPKDPYGGQHFREWEFLELSIVGIPANPDAVITGIKSIDDELHAARVKQSDRAYRSMHGATGASGRSSAGNGPPGQSGINQPASSGGFFYAQSKGMTVKTLQELRDERAQKATRLKELMDLRTAENRRFNDEEAKEFDDLSNESAALDDDIRVMQYQETQARAATPVRGKSVSEGSQSRQGMGFVKRQDPDDKFKGQSFVRMQIAKALAMVHGESPIAIAQDRWGKTHPKLVEFMKAAVAGGGTSSGEWAAELAALDGRFTGDFIEFLYAKTVFDQLPLREIPARVKVKGQDGAFTGYWVGESKGIPASAGDYSTVDLTPLKVAGLAVISMELLEDSQPSAEMLVRDGLAEASSQRVDQTFLSATAASSGVSPAGILNGVSALTPSGGDLAHVRADLAALLYPFVSAKKASGITLIANPATGLALSMMYGSLDQPAFPDISENGGTLNKRPVIMGDNVTPGHIIALRPQDIWKIGDSGVRISMSKEATIEQDTAPQGATDTPVAASANMTNMFQEESVAFKVVRRINFQVRRTGSVQFLQDTEYGGVVS